MDLIRYRIAALTLLSIAICLPAVADEAKLVARVLDPFEFPSAVAIDPLDDNDETMAAVAVIEKAISDRNIAIRSDAAYTLEIEVDPAARTPYLGRGDNVSPSGSYHEGRRDNPVNELAPSPELAPKAPDVEQPRAFGATPHLAVILMLYKHQQPPGWIARAIAPRDNRPIEEQVAVLASLAMLHLGETAVIGFAAESEE